MSLLCAVVVWEMARREREGASAVGRTMDDRLPGTRRCPATRETTTAQRKRQRSRLARSSWAPATFERADPSTGLPRTPCLPPSQVIPSLLKISCARLLL